MPEYFKLQFQVLVFKNSNLKSTYPYFYQNENIYGGREVTEKYAGISPLSLSFKSSQRTSMWLSEVQIKHVKNFS